jgi:hypothetical protein
MTKLHLTLWSKVLLSDFYGNQRFITGKRNHWILPSARWIQSAHSHPNFFKIHLNIIIPSTPRSVKWLQATNIMLDPDHCLRQIWYIRHFEGWLYSRLQVTDCHYAKGKISNISWSASQGLCSMDSNIISGGNYIESGYSSPPRTLSVVRVTLFGVSTP